MRGLKKSRAGHSLYLPGGSRPQYGRHIYLSNSVKLEPIAGGAAAVAITSRAIVLTSDLTKYPYQFKTFSRDEHIARTYTYISYVPARPLQEI